MLKISLPKSPKYTATGDNRGKIEIEACYPGYGTTLANALRRILLSSLTGTAVTSVKISGVSHEFSTIPGVKEDVIQIILNLKKVRFRSHKDEPIKLTLKEKGAKKITAAQIQCPADVEVINKEFPIAEITDKKGEIEMEIEVRKGLGYVPVEQQEREVKEIGLIAIDAIFTPVRRVNYSIENMRVGRRTDFDKITFDIETDGTVTPEEAYEAAAQIALEQFEAIKAIEQPKKAEDKVVEDIPRKEEISALEAETAEKIEQSNISQTEVTSLSFSTRTLNVLEKNNIKYIGDLTKYSEEGLKTLAGMGDKGIKEIKKAIGNFGLTLK